MARERVEDTAYIDIQQVISLDKGEMYNLDFGIGIKTTGIFYEDHCKIGKQIIRFANTKNGFGSRKWFICPCCKKNFKRLYMTLSANVWACRNHHQLTYTKSQLSGNDFKYVTWQIKEMQHELGVSKENYIPRDGALVDSSIEWLPLFKPKYMRWETFTEKRVILELMMLARLRIWAENANK